MVRKLTNAQIRMVRDPVGDELLEKTTMFTKLTKL